ncbi:hypothetical protein DES53_11810 [Roseimicrobium gellanilyticum]|uniref:Dolichyl-phosphate-mannose-protein mannosyltransferase n=1 Tax=Roseimicrobium gellanilyticum TaxID=748857 RepID=A0A366H2D9_9BACT|nr:hypothetical protein [Roseimicrobium gellanilyticum]RBP36062.1 hypothetical protein DES53_11810 [Roseimicrobium gellanilyticum]
MELVETKVKGLRWETAIFIAVTLVYSLWITTQHTETLVGDEPRYWACAENMTKGYLVTDDNPDFVNGPGYTIALYPYVKFGIPLYWARIQNAVFCALAAAFLFRTVRTWASDGWAKIATAWFVLHPDTWINAKDIVTESLTFLLVSALAWSFMRTLTAKSGAWKWVLLTSVILTWLVMTRVMFGHVITAMLVGSLGCWAVWKSLRQTWGRTVGVLALSFLMCQPYLFYTKAKTGTYYRWSTNSGELLYWATATSPGTNGHWYNYDEAQNLPQLAPYHREFIARIIKLPVLEREAEFTRVAKENLRTAPKSKLAYNWVCNVCRYFIGLPAAFKNEGLTTVIIVCFHVPFLILMAAAAWFALRRPFQQPGPLIVLAVFACIYMGGSTLATARSRYFTVITPVLWVVATPLLRRHLRLEILPDDEPARPKV